MFYICYWPKLLLWCCLKTLCESQPEHETLSSLKIRILCPAGVIIMSFDVLNNPFNERRWKTPSVQQSSYGKPQTWSVLGELTTYEVTYLSGSLFVEGSMFLRDSYATTCYFGQPRRLLAVNKRMEKNKSPFIFLYLHYFFKPITKCTVVRCAPTALTKSLLGGTSFLLVEVKNPH